MAVVGEDLKNWLKSLLGEGVWFEEPMSRHTSFKVGGPADVLAAPADIRTLVELIRGLEQRMLPWLVVGGGTNLLVRDGGIRGVVIVLKEASKKIRFNPETGLARAGAGAGLNALCGFALREGLSGMNFALGIPGTVGGGVVMNAGTALGTMEKVLREVKVLLADGRIEKRKRDALQFSYRKLKWNNGDQKERNISPIVLEAEFALTPDDPEVLKKSAQEIIKTRKEKQPSWLPSAGCFFKNPPSAMPAGMLIDLAGLKGVSVGGAEVSQKHGNFIINCGTASAADILSLQEMVRETVKSKFDVDLEPEVQIVGE